MTQLTPERQAYLQNLTAEERQRYEHLWKTRPSDVRTDLVCADCKAPLALRLGRYGRFYGCVMFPETGCRGGVSADETGRPKGWPGDATTRAARRRVVRHFEQLAGRHAHIMDVDDADPPGWPTQPSEEYHDAVRRVCRALGKDPAQGLRIGELSLEECLRVLDDVAPSRWTRLTRDDIL